MLGVWASLCACRGAVGSLVPGALPSSCASSVYSVVGQASTQASSGSAATSFSWMLSVWNLQESGIIRLLSAVSQ